MKLILSLSLSLTLISMAVVNSPSKNPIPRPLKQSTVDKTRERQVFQKAKKLLEKKGMPFNVDELLESDWRDRLAPAFAQMSELRAERRLAKQLAGVQLAD